MSLLLFFDRCKRKIEHIYRKSVFRKKIKCPHKDFSLVGNVYLINTNIIIGHNVTIYPDVMFLGDGPIIIGDYVDIGNGTIIYASKSGGGVTIGCNTIIAAQCYIIDMDHGTAANELIRNQSNTVSPIIIGEDVWIAAGVKILKGSHINNGSIIGAQSVVKGEILDYSIVVGIPAKEKKKRE